jgi:hypothetical protein
MNKNKWNWGAFLSCPIWSIFHGFYLGLFSILVPVLIGLLLIFAKANFPIVSQVCFGILLMVYFLYLACLMPLIYVLESLKIFDVKNDYVRLGLFSIAFYLYWSAYAGINSNVWLYQNKSKKQLSIINKNNKLWVVLGVLMFIPTIITINYITVKLIIETTGFMGA